MKALDLRRMMSPAVIPAFDYAAIGDAEVAQQLRETADKIRGLQDAASIGIGRALLSVKDKLEHGQFLDWIEAEFVFGRRTAVRMMQVATEFGDKWDTVSHLPTTVLYKLAAPSTPPAVREAVLGLRPSEVITPRGVQSAIAAVRKAEGQKARRDNREKMRQEQAAHHARWEAQDAKERAKREKIRLATEAATERVKALLSGVLPDLAEILETIDPFTFGLIAREMIAEYRARSKGPLS